MCDTDFGTFLCRPLQNNNVKWPNSKSYVEREHTTVSFLFSTWTVMPSLQSQLPDYSATLDRLNESKLSRKSLKYLEVILKVTFSLTLPSWLLKFPIEYPRGGGEEWSLSYLQLKRGFRVFCLEQGLTSLPFIVQNSLSAFGAKQNHTKTLPVE